MSNGSDKSNKDRVETYVNYNKGIGENYRQNIKVLDNQILVLAGGMLGLSLTFISNLVDLEDAVWLPLLLFSWGLLAASIVTVLSGLRYSTKFETIEQTLDHGKQLTGVGPYKKDGPDLEGSTKKAKDQSRKIDKFNKWSYLLFIAGLISMFAFISLNILRSVWWDIWPAG